MTWYLIAVLFGAIQTVPAHPVAAFVGTWTSTEVPPPGEAPLGPPSFELQIKNGAALVTVLRRPPTEATVYRVAPQSGRVTLMLTLPAGSRMDLLLIRILDAKRAELDLFMTPKDPVQTATHVPLGIFARSK